MGRNREEFIAKFVAAFLAAHAAGRYAEYCSTGRAALLDDHPAEDAVHLAQSAWAQFVAQWPTAR